MWQLYYAGILIGLFLLSVLEYVLERKIPRFNYRMCQLSSPIVIVSWVYAVHFVAYLPLLVAFPLALSGVSFFPVIGSLILLQVVILFVGGIWLFYQIYPKEYSLT